MTFVPASDQTFQNVIWDSIARFVAKNWFRNITPKFRQGPNAACNTKPNVTYLVSYWWPCTVEEGDISIVFVKGLELALPPKVWPLQSQIFKDVNNSQAFTQKYCFSHPLRFLVELHPGCQRRVYTKFHANVRRPECVWSIWSHFLRQVSNIIVKTHESRGDAEVCTFQRINNQMFTPFSWDEPWTSSHVLYMPLPTHWRSELLFCFASTKNWDPPRQKSPRRTKTETSGETERNMQIPNRNRSAGVNLTCVPNFAAYLKKTAWTFAVE